jgi:siroheme synthase-like protein
MSRVPVALELKGVTCLVVGAGRVSDRKVAMLLRAGARVRVVAPDATKRIRSLARSGLLRWTRAIYRPAHLRGSGLVLAATSDPAVNRAVAREARRRGIFVNVADDASLCTLVLAAVLRRGPLVVSVATSGESPAVARALRDDLARHCGPEYGAYVRIIGALRRTLRSAVPDPAERARRYRRLLRVPLLPLLRSGRTREARRAARHAAGIR